MGQAVKTPTPVKSTVVATELERCGNFAIGQGLTATDIIDVVGAVLQVDAQGLAFRHANLGPGVVRPVDVGEAATVAEYFTISYRDKAGRPAVPRRPAQDV